MFIDFDLHPYLGKISILHFGIYFDFDFQISYYHIWYSQVWYIIDIRISRY